MPTLIDKEILAAAIEGFEAQRKRLDTRIAEIRQQLTGIPMEEEAAEDGPEATDGRRKRRKMSPAARKRIADAQKKRWAAVRKESAPVAKKAAKTAAKTEAPKAKRRLSAAGRKRIIDATKKRWAAVRAASETAAT
jgi:hypothetical protein